VAILKLGRIVVEFFFFENLRSWLKAQNTYQKFLSKSKLELNLGAK